MISLFKIAKFCLQLNDIDIKPERFNQMIELDLKVSGKINELNDDNFS